MKALWEPEAGRLLSLPSRSSTQKKKLRDRWIDKGNGEVYSSALKKKKNVDTEHKIKVLNRVDFINILFHELGKKNSQNQ